MIRFEKNWAICTRISNAVFCSSKFACHGTLPLPGCCFPCRKRTSVTSANGCSGDPSPTSGQPGPPAPPGGTGTHSAAIVSNTFPEIALSFSENIFPDSTTALLRLSDRPNHRELQTHTACDRNSLKYLPAHVIHSACAATWFLISTTAGITIPRSS